MTTIIKQVSDIVQSIDTGVPVDVIFSSHEENIKRCSLHEKYFLVSQLLDQIGPVSPRLDLIHKIITLPTFLSDKTPVASNLTETLVNSSYWLDRELFNTRYLKKDIRRLKLTGTEYAHIRLLDIGCVFMGKGFSLNQSMSNTEAPIRHWTNIFIEQCRERKKWLKKIATHTYSSQLPHAGKDYIRE